MRCHICNHTESKVIDSRPSHSNRQVRRRRECLGCQNRFTTYELVQETPLHVLKRDGRREEFSREKILQGLSMACKKRPLPIGTLEKVVERISLELARSTVREVPSQLVGELALEELVGLDPVGYLRFASVYKNFSQPRDFLLELEQLFTIQERALTQELQTGNDDPDETDITNGAQP